MDMVPMLCYYNKGTKPMQTQISKIKTGAAAHGQKSKRFNLILPKDVTEELDLIAKEHRISRNSVIYHAILEYLERRSLEHGA
jgi:predicted HicB family RNase H-like nuclease